MELQGIGSKVLQAFQDSTGEACQIPENKQGRELSVQEAQELLFAQFPLYQPLINKLIQGPTSEGPQQQCGKPDQGGTRCGVTILEARVKTEQQVAEARPVPPLRIDPYLLSYQLPADADHALVFNVSRFNREGFAALMGASHREGANEGVVSTAGMFKPEGTIVQETSIGRNARNVKFAEENAPEFRPGDGSAVVALKKCGGLHSFDVTTSPINESETAVYPGKLEGSVWVPDTSQPPRSRNVQKGDHLDVTPPDRFKDRVKVELSFPETFSPRNWVWEQLGERTLAMSMMLERGFIFEPGARATATLPFANISATTEVKGKDAIPEWIEGQGLRFLGSPTQTAKGGALPTLNWAQIVMNGTVDLRVSTSETKRDVAAESLRLFTMLPAELDTLKFAGAPAGVRLNGAILQDVPLARDKTQEQLFEIEKRPAEGACATQGGSGWPPQVVDLTLAKGFFELGEGSLKGYKIEYGITSQSTGWKPMGRTKIGDGCKSDELPLSIRIDDPQKFELEDGAIEVRLLSPKNCPIKRGIFRFAPIEWTADTFK